ncbi:hypothetical protein GFY24_25165 [Nocardia sp. SYP-A9097]|uniref:hypothetical protein n=1 Tax=Nocardia sp. SYP-A9097 TaxID=2663237 RepID=UPI00129A7B78|nr:hypothetical protein [Nocardia sp. SYP-A9097]MRH90691.1 hypothetical protein [Nocardia sp. SYP-A9097]
MIVIIGLVILIAAVLVGVAGVFANGGIGLAGLAMLLADARRTARLGASARRELKAVRQDTAVIPRLPERQQPLTMQRGAAPTRYTGTADAPIEAPGADVGTGADDRPPTRGHVPGKESADSVPLDLPRGSQRR